MKSAAICLVLLQMPLLAQGPAFEVASVKPSPPVGDSYSVSCKGGPGSDDPGTFNCHNMSLANLLVRAYHVDYNQVSGPDWLRTAFFEINAKVPAGVTADDFRGMIRDLLVARFGLVAHHEAREMPVFDLVVAKGGPKLKSEGSDVAPPSTDKDAYPKVTGPGMAMSNGHGAAAYPKGTMKDLAKFLTGQEGRPVTDATGLEGEFSIRLYWVSDRVRDSATTDPGPSLEQAVQDQLGLRLVAKKGSADVLVVDHCEKVPTEN